MALLGIGFCKNTCLKGPDLRYAFMFYASNIV